MMIRKVFLPLCLFAAAVASAAQENAPAAKELQEAIAALQKQTDIVWTIVAAALVFFMQAGFAMVETGFTRRRVQSRTGPCGPRGGRHARGNRGSLILQLKM
jgi:Amt family ammonium transporter